MRRICKMPDTTHTVLINAIRETAHPLTGATTDYDPLMNLIGDARFVLLGEASHGTHEFYRMRAEITQRLISEKGFMAVAVEADWPDAYRVNRYVRGVSDDATANEALVDFRRFPTWMWRNADVLDFVGWLRDHNEAGGDDGKVGFYGMDLYSLHASMRAVLRYLDRVDPEAADRARARYACFDHFGEDPQAYGYAAAFGAGESCEREVIEQLVDLQEHAVDRARRDGLLAEDELFYAEQNARTVKAAEEYYRTMFGGRVSSWNLRDRHMTDTLDALSVHLSRQAGRQARIVVWAHNSHLGDARATEMASLGEYNVGQLVRERHTGHCRLLGFTTSTGTVTAADDWGGRAERKRVRPALPGSVEELLHQVGTKEFVVRFAEAPQAAAALRSTR